MNARSAGKEFIYRGRSALSAVVCLSERIFMHSSEYLNYIKSHKWKRKREKKLKQVNYRCLAYDRGDCKGSLQVHHIHYHNLGRERLSDLQVFCKSHHKNADKARRRIDGPIFSDWEIEYTSFESETLFTDEDSDSELSESNPLF